MEQPVWIGYMRVSKADGSQTLDLQRDALLAAGVEPGHPGLGTSKSGTLQPRSASAEGLYRPLPVARTICHCRNRREAQRWPQSCWYSANVGLKRSHHREDCSWPT